jgi:hypothetical protein
MKGEIVQLKQGLGVEFSKPTFYGFQNIKIPINPYQQTEELNVGSWVEFDIEKFWETGIEEPFDVAVLSNNNVKK